MQHKGRILVVEPNDLIVGLLERWLSEAGYTVTIGTLQNWPQAVSHRDEPCLVIIDVPTPRSAEKVIKLIQMIRAAHASPILLVSARFRRGAGSSVSVARELGVTSVLPKPFTRDELMSAIRESIDRQ